MKISVVTVCYNEEKNIAATIESVLNQTSTDIEYIICDGQSKDGTVQIAESYKDAFLQKGIEYIVHSEKDGGIYFGMNSGIDMAAGDYVIFINAGDKLYANDVIEKIVKFLSDADNQYDVVYGDVMCIERGFTSLYVGDDAGLFSGMSICHQAILIKSDVIKKNKFDTQYRIVADYDMVLKLKIANCSFYRIDLVIAFFQQGGVSSTKTNVFVKEYFDIWDKHGIENNKLKFRINNWKDKFAYIVKMKMPKKLWVWWCKNKRQRMSLNGEDT